MTSSSELHQPAEIADPPMGSVLFSWIIFPIAFLGSVGLSIEMLNRGQSSDVATVASLGFGYGVVILGERLYPYVLDWNRNHDDVATDAAWAGTTIISGAFFRPAFAAGGALGAAALATFVSPQPQSTLWPNDWPLAAQLALALFLVEFFHYWVHRLQHETDWLWRFHATHHSAPRLYWLNAARFHIVDIALLGATFTIPLVALGAEPRILGLWIVASTIHGICQHANMQIRCGPLNWIFSMAELHRWHHSPVLGEANTNYGQTLILWDIVFRTRRLPTNRKSPTEIGIADLPEFPMTWWAQLLSPWRWDRATAQSAEHSPSSPVGGTHH